MTTIDILKIILVVYLLSVVISKKAIDDNKQLLSQNDDFKAIKEKINMPLVFNILIYIPVFNTFFSVVYIFDRGKRLFY